MGVNGWILAIVSFMFVLLKPPSLLFSSSSDRTNVCRSWPNPTEPDCAGESFLIFLSCKYSSEKGFSLLFDWVKVSSGSLHFWNWFCLVSWALTQSGVTRRCGTADLWEWGKKVSSQPDRPTTLLIVPYIWEIPATSSQRHACVPVTRNNIKTRFCKLLITSRDGLKTLLTFSLAAFQSSCLAGKQTDHLKNSCRNKTNLLQPHRHFSRSHLPVWPWSWRAQTPDWEHWCWTWGWTRCSDIRASQPASNNMSNISSEEDCIWSVMRIQQPPSSPTPLFLSMTVPTFSRMELIT